MSACGEHHTPQTSALADERALAGGGATPPAEGKARCGQAACGLCLRRLLADKDAMSHGPEPE